MRYNSLMTNTRTIALIFSNETPASEVDKAVDAFLSEKKINAKFSYGSFYADRYFYYIDFFNYTEEEIDNFAHQILDVTPQIADFIFAA